MKTDREIQDALIALFRKLEQFIENGDKPDDKGNIPSVEAVAMILRLANDMTANIREHIRLEEKGKPAIINATRPTIVINKPKLLR